MVKDFGFDFRLVLVRLRCSMCELDIDDVFEYFEQARKAETAQDELRRNTNG